MPSLDSPLVTLGALFVAGQSEKGRQFTGGESGKGLLAGGFAASSAQFAVDEVRGMAGIDSTAVSDELAQALVGAGVSRFGGPIPYNRAMARGIMYSVAGQGFTDAGMTLGDFAGDLNLGGGGSPTTAGMSQPSASHSVGNNRSSGKVY